jgi:hypothetical protein
VKPVIADPAQLTGHEYLVTFYHAGSDVRWQLFDRALAQVRFSDGIITLPPEYPHPVVDGVQYLLEAPGPGIADFLTVADANGSYASPWYGSFQLSNSGFPSAMYPGAPPGNGLDRPYPNAGGAQWGMHAGAAAIKYDYRYQKFVTTVFRGDNITRFTPYDFELRFTPSGGRAWSTFSSSSFLVDVPFELWNIGRGTPDNPIDDHRMIPWIFDVNGDGIFNLDRADHPISPSDNDPETDWIFWYEPYDKSPGIAGYINEFVQRGAAYDGTDGNGHSHQEVMARMTLVNHNGGSVSASNWPLNVNQQLCESGMVFRIVGTQVNVAGDSLRLRTPERDPGIPFSIHLEQNFPNPFNPVTTIRFGLTDRSPVELQVFDILGRRVRTLVSGELDPGFKEVFWDSRNEAGTMVGSAVYFYRLRVGQFTQTRKMLLLK